MLCGEPAVGAICSTGKKGLRGGEGRGRSIAELGNLRPAVGVCPFASDDGRGNLMALGLKGRAPPSVGTSLLRWLSGVIGFAATA